MIERVPGGLNTKFDGSRVTNSLTDHMLTVSTQVYETSAVRKPIIGISGPGCTISSINKSRAR